MQRIPLGAGVSRHAVRRAVPTVATWPAWQLGAIGLGLTAALAGIALFLAEPEVTVRMDQAGYTVAGQTLRSQGGDVYQGRGGAALVVERRGGSVVAAASATIGGKPSTGRCTLQAGSAREECVFTLESGSVTATDIRTTTGWERHYSDGVTIAIRLLGDPDTPVPFPVGR